MPCPNHSTCQLIHIPGFVQPESLRDSYMEEFCTSGTENWKNCRRLQTHGTLHFCPDFVLPDTCLSVDEIMERFDHELYQSQNTNN